MTYPYIPQLCSVRFFARCMDQIMCATRTVETKAGWVILYAN